MKSIVYIVVFGLLGISHTVYAQQANNPIQLIDCEPIYPGKRYEVQLIQLKEIDPDCGEKNRLFKLIDKQNSKVIMEDSILSVSGEIRFEDFNNDQVKDILIQNRSSARGNESYNLYLVDTTQNRLTKVKGFELVSQPTFHTKLNIVESYALSGRDWSAFYKIRKDTVIDLGYVIYWNEEDEDGNPRDPYKDYNDVLKQIKKTLKRK